jgi:hypothetical protein
VRRLAVLSAIAVLALAGTAVAASAPKPTSQPQSGAPCPMSGCNYPQGTQQPAFDPSNTTSGSTAVSGENEHLANWSMIFLLAVLLVVIPMVVARQRGLLGPRNGKWARRRPMHLIWGGRSTPRDE